VPDLADLTALREVIEGPLREIADRFSRFLADDWPHQALVIFTRECTGRPRKVTGTRAITDKITIAELEALKATVPSGHQLTTTATLGGTTRTVWAAQDPIGTLLVLVPRSSRTQFPRSALLAEVFGIVATSIRQQVTQASPDYLAESRAASSERARTIAEMAAAHETALVTVLTTLRSTTTAHASPRPTPPRPRWWRSGRPRRPISPCPKSPRTPRSEGCAGKSGRCCATMMRSWSSSPRRRTGRDCPARSPTPPGR
jgi:hypothetical protein